MKINDTSDICPAVFCLFAHGKTTGIVLDSGECTTSAIPVYDGTPIARASKQLNFGGRDISEYIQRHLSQHAISFTSVGDLDALDKIKREACYCGAPPDSMHAKSYRMPDGTSVELDDWDDFPAHAPQQFFFDPTQLDWDDTELEDSVHDTLHAAVMECPIDTRRDMWGNTILSGGNTLFSGFADTLYKKLKPLPGCRNVNLKLRADANRDTQAWLGASVVATMDSFMDNLISQEAYEEEGPEVVHKLNIFSL